MLWKTKRNGGWLKVPRLLECSNMERRGFGRTGEFQRKKSGYVRYYRETKKKGSGEMAMKGHLLIYKEVNGGQQCKRRSRIYH